jgi:hypothetical protein
MIQLLALIGLIVVMLLLFNGLKKAGVAISRWGEAVLDRLSAGMPVPAPACKCKEVEELEQKIEAVKGEKRFPNEQEIRDEIDRLTSQS